MRRFATPPWLYLGKLLASRARVAFCLAVFEAMAQAAYPLILAAAFGWLVHAASAGHLDLQRLILIGIPILVLSASRPVRSYVLSMRDRDVVKHIRQQMMRFWFLSAGFEEPLDSTTAARLESVSTTGVWQLRQLLTSWALIVGSRLTALGSIALIFQAAPPATPFMIAARWLTSRWARTQAFAHVDMTEDDDYRASKYVRDVAVDGRYSSEFESITAAPDLVRMSASAWRQAMVRSWKKGLRAQALVALYGTGALILVAVGLYLIAYDYSLHPARTLTALQAAILYQTVWAGETEVVVAENAELLRRLAPALEPVPALDSEASAAGPLAIGIALTGVGLLSADGSPIVTDLTLRVPPGALCIVVGENGAGKTSLLRLVAGLAAPSYGSREYLDNQGEECPYTSIRPAIAYLPQRAWQYPGTIGENVSLGGRGDVAAALEKVGLQGLARERSGQRLDPRLIDGANLSGGEWQRVALARVLARERPVSLLVLDEATGHLDPIAARGYLSLARQQVPQATIIAAAHRGAPVEDADLVVLMESGQMRAVGRHPELLESSPAYRDYWRSLTSA